MCCGSKSKVYPTGMVMEVRANHSPSLLLEFSATNDVEGFKHMVEEEGHDLDEVGVWYGRRFGSKKMGFEERTPLMIAAMFGSMDVLNYIVQRGCVDVNQACGSDGATPLHCAAGGGSLHTLEVIKLLLDSSADVNQFDADGNRPVDVIALWLNSCSKLKRKTLEILLRKGGDGVSVSDQVEEIEAASSPKSVSDGYKNGSEKKEYPIDPSLPDIKNGIYVSDEFRMFTFKIKPCSRAYSHDWTECPFVHPGENARRRDPRKYHYSCVPCPEFRKGSCPKGDACEYAHGIFECWLHPAQYRTRLCKDETNCNRRVCFFAHKPEDLRPLYASTGSAVPSPRSSYSFDMAPLSPLGLGSPSMLIPSTSTPPLTPTSGSSPVGGGTWPNPNLNHFNITPPTLQLPGSRFKAALSARDINLEAKFRRQQYLLDELAGLNAMNQHHHHHQLHSAYSSSGMPSSPVRASSFGIDPCGSPSPVSNPRLAAFTNRSQSFIDRSGSPYAMHMPTSPHLSDWGSPNGKLDWGVQADELSKLRKSASFGVRTNGTNIGGNPNSATTFSDGSNMIPPWVEHLYMEQEPMAA